MGHLTQNTNSSMSSSLNSSSSRSSTRSFSCATVCDECVFHATVQGHNLYQGPRGVPIQVHILRRAEYPHTPYLYCYSNDQVDNYIEFPAYRPALVRQTTGIDDSLYLNLVKLNHTGHNTMFDYKGILTNITGFAKTSFYVTLRRGAQNSSNNNNNNNNSAALVETNAPSTSRQAENERRGRGREQVRRHHRLSSSEGGRSPTVIGREAREDGIYTEETGVGSPIVVVVSCYNVGDMTVEKNAELEKKKKEEEAQQEKPQKKKNRRELNIPQRNMFAPDFVIQPDEDLPGFSPIDSEYDSDEEVEVDEDVNINEQRAPSQTQSATVTSIRRNLDIPNEYDPVIGIIAIQGVPIPRSRPIDIVPNHEPLFPFFGASTDLQIMLITELMYDVFKERIRTKGKERILALMENLAMTISVGQFCGRLLPVEMMDQSIYYYDYDAAIFLSKSELINLLMLCEPDELENSMVASSVPHMFHRESPEQILERDRYYQFLMSRPQIFVRRTGYMSTGCNYDNFASPLITPADDEHTKRLALERQLKDENLNHEKMNDFIEKIWQDLEEVERRHGRGFLRRITRALYDARVAIPSVN